MVPLDGGDVSRKSVLASILRHRARPDMLAPLTSADEADVRERRELAVYTLGDITLHALNDVLTLTHLYVP